MGLEREKFIPYIPDFEREAENFLRHYGYKEAIQTPMRIPIEESATKRMTLEIVDALLLSEDESVQGATVFCDGIIDAYDPEENEYFGVAVDAGTILIDADVKYEGRRNNTLAHECFHWYRHREYFLYRAKWEESKDIAFRCEKSRGGSKEADTKWSDEERMEWQANRIAPKILMPRKAFRKKTNELAGLNKTMTIKEVTVETVLNLANFFGVSVQSAAIRLDELGYALPSHVSERPSPFVCGASESLSIKKPVSAKLEDIFELYVADQHLRDIVNTGQICYVDGFLTLNKPEFVRDSEEGICMTQRAKENLAKCVIGLSEKYKRKYGTPPNGLLYRSDGEYERHLFTDRTPQNTHIYDEAQELERLELRFEESFEKSKDMNETANQLLRRHMKRAKWNTTTFQDKTLLSPMDYSRVKEEEHPFKKQTLMAMAVGLKLQLSEFEEVLKRNGQALSPTDKTDQAYAFILTAMQGRNIYACNDFLVKIGIEPLGSKSRK